MVIVGMSVVATVIVLQFHHHNPDSGQMPRWVSFTDESQSWTTLGLHMMISLGSI